MHSQKKNGELSEDSFNTGCACYSYLFYITAKTSKEALKKINYFYRTLRGGLNEYRRSGNILYFKSSLHFYATKHDLQWDKKSVKEFLLNHSSLKTKKKQPTNLPALRDMLGLSLVEKWGNSMITKTCTNKKGEKVERFKSPIQFKPIRYNEEDYVVFFDVFPERNGFFDLQGGRIKVKSSTNNQAELSLSIPDNICLHEMFDEIFSEIDISSTTELYSYDPSSNEGEEIFKTIEDIYNEVKNNMQ